MGCKLNTDIQRVQQAPSQQPATKVGPAKSLSAMTAQNSKVTIQWSQSSVGDPPTHYDIFRDTGSNVDTDGTPLATVAAGQLSFVDNTVTNGTTYYYAVTSRNSSGKQLSTAAVIEATPWNPSASFDSNNVFVDFSEESNGDGSYSSPFNKLIDGDGAYAAVNAGGTINIFDSTWTGANLTIDKGVTIRSLSGDHNTSDVIFDGSGLFLNTGGTLLEANVKVMGIEIRNWSDANYFYNSAYRSLILSGNYFHDNDHFFVNYNQDGSGYTGLTFHAINNKVENLNGTFKSAFILIGLDSSDIVFLGNDINIVAWNALQVTRNIDSQVLIQNNKITKTQDNGIQLNGDNGAVVIRDNRVSEAGLSLGDSTSGCLVFWDLATNDNSVLLERNYFYNCYNAVSLRDNDYTQTDADKVTFTNNFFSSSNTVNFYIGGNSVVDLDVSNNYWGSADGPGTVNNVISTPYLDEWDGIQFE